MTLHEAFKQKTCERLALKSGFRDAQIAWARVQFDAIALKEGPEQAMRTLLAHYGSEASIDGIVNETKASLEIETGDAYGIRKALEKANKKTIEANPLIRLRETIKRFNDNLDAASQINLEIGGIKLSEEARERLNKNLQGARMKVPDCLNVPSPIVHQAKATYRGDNVPMEIKVDFNR